MNQDQTTMTEPPKTSRPKNPIATPPTETLKTIADYYCLPSSMIQDYQDLLNDGFVIPIKTPFGLWLALSRKGYKALNVRRKPLAYGTLEQIALENHIVFTYHAQGFKEIAPIEGYRVVQNDHTTYLIFAHVYPYKPNQSKNLFFATLELHYQTGLLIKVFDNAWRYRYLPDYLKVHLEFEPNPWHSK